MNSRITLEMIQAWLKDEDWRVRAAAMNACQGRDIPLDIIQTGLKDEDCDVRAAAMNACQGRDIPLDIIQTWLKDEDWRVRTAAMNACQGRDIPLDIIQTWLKDEDCDVRAAAMNACQGRDIPFDIIQTWLKDEDWRVRTAAVNACQGRDIVIRTIEPPERVFKKCINDVIVVAHIPDNANVRGTFNSKCRADRAEIIDIIGDVSGYKIGISMFDKSTAYFVGDKVVIEDFDFSTDECSTGFHFFNTLEEAQAYD